MISVLTITYKRRHLLEEAIESFLRQPNFGEDHEMVIINDAADITYSFDHPSVRIINVQDRFSSIGKKLEFGYKQCRNNFIYRLDDDDLLAPWALEVAVEDIRNNPGYEIYRSNAHYFFMHNKYTGTSDNINNGNIYTKSFLDRIVFPEKSGTEDVDITFNNDAKILYSTQERKTMIYRWGMGTYHISGWGDKPSEVIMQNVDNILPDIANGQQRALEQGTIVLQPHFDEEYYHELPAEHFTTQ